MIPAPLFAIVRYLVSWLCIWLVGHGWTIANLDGPTTDAVAQLAAGGAGAIAMMAIGAWRSRVPVLLDRLKQHHKPALVAAAGAVSLDKATDILVAAANVPGVKQIIAESTVAAATPSDKVVAAGQG